MRPPVLALVGPTASGKSGLALALAARWPVEVVSMDSALVYRGMDIGSAKPSVAERAQVVHHLIDIRDPHQSYSAAEFAADTRPLLAAIQARGRIPLLVGGTFLYLKALTDGLDPMPSADPALRHALQQRAAALGWPALHAELAVCDPLSAARLSPNDGQRIGRALEVWQCSGRPLSDFQRASGQGWTLAPGCLISLEPDDRAWLHQRIAQRLAAMFKAGMLDEVRRLRAQPGLHPDLPSMRCVGYRQCWQALDATDPMHCAQPQKDNHTAEAAASAKALGAAPQSVKSPTAPLELEHSELFQRCLFATRQLAKRQLTWLRSLAQRHRVACDAADTEARVLRHVEGLLQAPSRD